MDCRFGHTWEWDGTRWVCSDCGQKAQSQNPLIEPCTLCGGDVDAQAAICEDCTG